jgi:exosortase
MTESARKLAASACVLGGVLAWAYWPTLADVVQRWSTNPQYSHGYLVPLFSAILLWHRRGLIRGESVQPSWWGLPWLAVGVALHLAAAYFYFEWAGAAALLPLLLGLVLCLGGKTLLRWSWPALAFLAFMLPLPFRIEVSLAYPLQRLATLASTYLLQTFGFPAVAEGNIIVMEEARIGVVEACNGLGMLMTFFALTTAAAILLQRPLMEKLLMVVSAVPIALFANVIRITITGMLAEKIGSEFADVVFHHWGGWTMMLLALGMMWIELKILAALLLELRPRDGLAYSFAGLGTPKRV